MEGYDYDAAASTIKLEDISTDETNRAILRKLKENDSEFVELLLVRKRDEDGGNYRRDENEFCPDGTCDLGGRELGWLGYFIGGNAVLQELHFDLNPFDGFSNDAIEAFCRGVNVNSLFGKLNCIGWICHHWEELFSRPCIYFSR